MSIDALGKKPQPCPQQSRAQRAALWFLVLVAFNTLAFIGGLGWAITHGQPVSALEWQDSDVIYSRGQHVRVTPEVKRYLDVHRNITILLLPTLILAWFIYRSNPPPVQARRRATAPAATKSHPKPGNE
jgi:hypothetical protein